jgi:hypothetical protein
VASDSGLLDARQFGLVQNPHVKVKDKGYTLEINEVVFDPIRIIMGVKIMDPHGKPVVNVTLIAGDRNATNETSVSIEGEDKGSFYSAQGEFSLNTFEVQVSDGQLNFDLSDRVNGIEVVGTGENSTVIYKFDFGTKDSPVADGYTKLSTQLNITVIKVTVLSSTRSMMFLQSERSLQ